VLSGLFLLPGCGGDTPSTPTQTPANAPQIACPAPVSVASALGLPLSVNYAAATVVGGTPPTTISCTPASGSTFPVGTTSVACTATDSARRTDACAFSVTVTAPPKLIVTRFLAYGDSMTWGEDGTFALTWLRLGYQNYPRVQLAGPSTYPGALQVLLSLRYTAQSPTVFNDGSPGEMVTDNVAFQTRFVPVVTSGRYDVLLLMEGVNDLDGSDPSRVTAALGAMQVMVQTAKNAGLRVFLATLPPENPDGFRAGNSPSIVPYNTGLIALAASARIPLVDVYQAFGGNLGLIGGDGLHPNAAGYAVIANTFLAAIEKNLDAPTPTSTFSIPGRQR
jgi:lysophospholipase L1-like esterase